MEVEHDRDAAMADSSAMAVKANQHRDLHATLLEACRGVIDVLLPVGVSVEEHLKNVPSWFTEVIHHVVRRGAALALAAATLWNSKDLHGMATRFPPMEKLEDADGLAMEFKSIVGAIPDYEGVEDVFGSAPYDV